MTKPNASKKIVFYADDDEDDLEFVRESFLEQVSDIQLICFSNAVELLQFIHTRKSHEPLPCLIILDINMPLLNGKEALRLLRTMDRYEEVPVVLFSTSSSPHDFYFARHYHADFFTKPLSSKQMDTIIEKFIDYCNERVKAG